ncbi:MAG: stage II sporulation protein M [Nanoarchaeota archaeon]|nr:stage II sporulation protein M [Nanoarchaeota archaeon]MBU1705062.1 stage II sporulation protein M [Nanoarchaeota archaeon]
MVLESLINPFSAEKRPWEMLFIGFLYSTIALFLARWIFSQYAGLVMVFLTVAACIPLMYSTIKMEEEKDVKIRDEGLLLKEHWRALSFFVFLFIGITLSFTLWYMVLPQSLSQQTFAIQSETISSINNSVTANAANFSYFIRIVLNNVKVLVFCILFSFLYGAGSIFILTWNGSVIATAIGKFIQSGAATSTIYHAAPLGLLRYLLHGIPEILAYFVAGLAGGIISFAVINHDFGSDKFQRILLDSTDLLLISFLIILGAGFVEAYITPLLF